MSALHQWRKATLEDSLGVINDAEALVIAVMELTEAVKRLDPST